MKAAIATEQIEAPAARNGKPTKAGFYERMFYRAVSDNAIGSLTVRLCDGSAVQLGAGTGGVAALMQVNDARAFKAAVLRGDIGFGEAFVCGWWDSEHPDLVLQWFMDNAESTPTFAKRLGRSIFTAPLSFLDRIAYLLRPNSKRTSLRNISEHYDLSNEFFSCMLDDSMAYSAGIYRQPGDSLHTAQMHKFETIARKLDLRPEHHLLEIGCGWGGFAIYAASRYGCRVTGVTISREQLEYARRQVARAGLEDRVEIRFQDYRDIGGNYDRIVSIEMVEALGEQYLDTFFRRCSELLGPEGLIVIQCITFPDAFYGRYKKDMDFTRKHIFPGSLLLSIRETLNSLGRTGQLSLYHLESIGQHYARTLSDWRRNFNSNLSRVKELGFDDAFIRKWNYYLQFCEVGFRSNYINDVQMLLSRPHNEGLKNYPYPEPRQRLS